MTQIPMAIGRQHIRASEMAQREGAKPTPRVYFQCSVGSRVPHLPKPRVRASPSGDSWPTHRTLAMTGTIFLADHIPAACSERMSRRLPRQTQTGRQNVCETTDTHDSHVLGHAPVYTPVLVMLQSSFLRLVWYMMTTHTRDVPTTQQTTAMITTPTVAHPSPSIEGAVM